MRYLPILSSVAANTLRISRVPWPLESVRISFRIDSNTFYDVSYTPPSPKACRSGNVHTYSAENFRSTDIDLGSHHTRLPCPLTKSACASDSTDVLKYVDVLRTPIVLSYE